MRRAQDGIRLEEAEGGTNAFALVFQTRYLLLMALMLMLSTGSTRPASTSSAASSKEQRGDLIAAGQAGGLTEGQQIIGDFYSKYFTAR